MPIKSIKKKISDALTRTRQRAKRLENTLNQKDKLIEDLKKKNEKLEKENEKLKDELKAARKPPAWVKENKSKAEDAKPAKKKGPKIGHKPNKRRAPPVAEQEIQIIPLACQGCDSKLPEPSKWHSHTQIDIPKITEPIITTFRTGWSWCSECKKHVSINDKLGNTLYGPRLHAYVCYLKFKMGLTLGKIEKLIKDQYGLWLSTGQLSEMIGRTADRLESNWNELKSSLSEQDHLHADETGWRIDGNNGWLWSFANEDVSFYTIENSRGQKVVEKVLGKTFSGVLVSDFYNGYAAIECRKQKCWPHLLRDLKEAEEKASNKGELTRYLKRVKRYFERGKSLQALFKKGKKVDKRLARLKTDTQKWADRPQSHPDLRRISKRLHKYRDELFTFVKTGTDPTNNFAEREVRPAVLMRKISYCNRSEDGARRQAILMSTIKTAEKRGQNFVETTTEQLTLH
jgi:transposase